MRGAMFGLLVSSVCLLGGVFNLRTLEKLGDTKWALSLFIGLKSPH